MNNQTLLEKKKKLFSANPVSGKTAPSAGRSGPYGNSFFRDPGFIARVPYLDAFLSTMACVVLIRDFRSLQVNYISSNIKDLWGYDVSMFYDPEVLNITDIIHPSDLEEKKEIEKVIWGQISKTPPEDRAALKFSFSYRVRKADGTYIWILEQNSVFHLDEVGNVTHLQVACSDVSSLKETVRTPISFSSYQSADCVSEKQKENLSSREIEVIRLIALGDNSKSIAAKLSISFNTVNTHRQHIFSKTKTRNASELVQFANKHGLI